MAEAITSVEICQGSHREWVQAGVLIPVVSAVVKSSYRLGWWESWGRRKISEMGFVSHSLCPVPCLSA